MRKILITGGAEFIGSQLGLKLTKNGENVILIDNMTDGHIDNILKDGKPFTDFKFKDVRDQTLGLDLEGVETIFHFAGTSSLPKCQANPVAAYDNNVSGLINILEFARKSNVKRVVFSSTSATYEKNADLPFREADHVAPNLIYATSKLAGENICKAYSEVYDMDIVVARFFNVYGEHQDIHRIMPPFVSYLAREVFLGKRPTIFNKSDAVRDYIYVGDVVAALELMKNSKKVFKGDIFNLCSGVGYSVGQIIDIFSKVSNQNIDPIFKDPSSYWDAFPALFEGKPLDRDRISKEVYKNSIGAPEKVEKVLGFKAAISFEEGLKKVREYSLSNLKRL